MVDMLIMMMTMNHMQVKDEYRMCMDSYTLSWEKEKKTHNPNTSFGHLCLKVLNLSSSGFGVCLIGLWRLNSQRF